MKNQRGMIAVDFLFALVLVMGFSSILFALSLTLTVAEVTQYITFAAARNFMAGHITPELQGARALSKYRQLLGNNNLTGLYTSGWFEVAGEPEIGDMTQRVPGYQQPAGSQNKFWGVGTRFIARMLEFQVPFYGSTAASGDGSGSGFGTFLGSYLGREISTTECLQFTAERWARIRALPSTNGGASYSLAPQNGYKVYDDNGC